MANLVAYRVTWVKSQSFEVKHLSKIAFMTLQTLPQPRLFASRNWCFLIRLHEVVIIRVFNAVNLSKALVLDISGEEDRVSVLVAVVKVC